MAIKFDDDDEKIIADINMTPLIDIMLVLLILFMVTSSVSLESGIDVELPNVKGKTEQKEATAVIISMGKSGVLSVQGQKVELSELSSAIEKALAAQNTTLAILEGDRSSNLGLAVQIMDIAKSAGAKSFAIAAQSDQ